MFSTRNPETTPVRLLLVLLAAQATLALAACESATEPEEDVMTQDEANALVQGLYGGNLLVSTGVLMQADPTALLIVPPGVPFPLDATIPCTAGGEAVFSGDATVSVNEAQGSMAVGLSGTLAAAGCSFTADGVTFVLDSDPGLVQSGSLNISLETFTFTLEIASSGSFSWASGTRAGSCSLDNAVTAAFSMLDAALSGAVPTATVSGSVCGLSVNRDISLAFIETT